ncbi:uncharacterized protein A4U43_C07F38550 [Asparagus officinalis]|uniref:Bifunctional inhibitor/plant lipid transfer protein/seed storage helical domain-containing protein n=1 Tax=Asparagus officinalis TaxID=4686 RepID=A0A5P1ENH7_ASPOF|nr:uncharacterized protein A4U43_C07F38550 [Asparagus officinalis]
MAHHLHSLLLLASILSLAGHGNSDLAADQAECTDKLIGLATCLPFVQGESKSPTPDCCTGYKQVTAKSIKCLCVLIKDRDDPSLGLNINVSMAILIPSKCGVPTNVSTCTSLLKLPPDSKYAKEFQQFESILEGKSKNEPGKVVGSTPAPTSDGRREKFFGVEMFPLLVLVLFLVFGS